MNTSVRISSRESNDTCQISVADEGPGFNKEELKQLFHENTKLSPKPTNGESSNGLGLSIVKKYVIAATKKVNTFFCHLFDSYVHKFIKVSLKAPLMR